jgi:uncharacterized protein (DUF1778 family)
MKNSILQPRTKLVNFRVTDEEYEALRHASIARGARCLSDFARIAVMQAASAAITTPAIDVAPTPHLVVFDRRISAIETQVARLVNHLPLRDHAVAESEE